MLPTVENLAFLIDRLPVGEHLSIELRLDLTEVPAPLAEPLPCGSPAARGCRLTVENQKPAYLVPDHFV